MKYTTSYYRWSGIRNVVNQDSLMIHHILIQKHEVLFCAVADGIGGLDCGEEASGFLLNKLSDWFYQICKDMIQNKEPFDSIELSLQSQIKHIQEKMADFQRHRKLDMGSTITGLLCIGKEYLLIHIGDSKGLLVRRKPLLSRLFSFLSKDKHQISIQQVTYDNVDTAGHLTHCIGMSGQDRIFLFRGRLMPGSLWLIGSDGILFRENYNFIKKSFGGFLQLTKDNMQIKLETLGRSAVTLGSKDNMAVLGVLVR